MLNKFLKKNNLLNFLINNKIYLIIYILLILFFIIYNFKKQNHNIQEHFLSFKKYNNKNIKHKECRKSCYVKYENNKENLKICKKYCSCSKKCNNILNNKKCMKKCKEIKKRIVRSKLKEDKMKLKKDLKKMEKKKKRQEEIKKARDEKLNKNKTYTSLKPERKGYFNYLINTYLSNDDKLYIYETNENVKTLFKDMKNIFKY